MVARILISGIFLINQAAFAKTPGSREYEAKVARSVAGEFSKAANFGEVLRMLRPKSERDKKFLEMAQERYGNMKPPKIEVKENKIEIQHGPDAIELELINSLFGELKLKGHSIKITRKMDLYEINAMVERVSKLRNKTSGLFEIFAVEKAYALVGYVAVTAVAIGAILIVGNLASAHEDGTFSAHFVIDHLETGFDSKDLVVKSASCEPPYNIEISGTNKKKESVKYKGPIAEIPIQAKKDLISHYQKCCEFLETHCSKYIEHSFGPDEGVRKKARKSTPTGIQ
jgi:hypothetical protein